ncbi:hypothetical protein F5X99DRAFT_405723 [Biscogniauxia marginata]|nr:hypothetical protein F5X99DRAFT_405723 [Biscogniauxia marginata]
MAKTNSKSHGSSSHGSKGGKRSGEKKASHSSSQTETPLVRYVSDGQRHEQIAVGQSTHEHNTSQYLQQWDASWQAASGHQDH